MDNREVRVHALRSAVELNKSLYIKQAPGVIMSLAEDMVEFIKKDDLPGNNP